MNKENVKSPLIKILYILLAGTGVFFIKDIYILAVVFGVHLTLWFALGNSFRKLKFLLKVKWFILILLVFNSLTTDAADFTLFKLWGGKLHVSYVGFWAGVLQSTKLLSMLLITKVVRNTMDAEAFIAGLKSMGLSESSASTIDKTFEVIAEGDYGKGHGGGKGKGKGEGKNKSAGSEKDEVSVTSWQVVVGKIGNIPNKIRKRLEEGQRQFGAHDGAVVGVVSLAATLVRMVKIAPGFPLAPGHKNVLLVPLFIYAAKKSSARFAATSVGLISGILHFAMGFGKYGPLGILQFVLFGFVIDLVIKAAPKKNNMFVYALAGGMAGLMRFSSELLLALIFGLPESFYLLYLPIVASQVLFGAGSSVIAVALFKEKNQTEDNE